MVHSSSKPLDPKTIKRLQEVNAMIGKMLGDMPGSYQKEHQTEESAINEAENSIREEIGLLGSERETYVEDGQLRWKIGERKIRAVWSPELVEDLKAYHSIDPAAELSAMLEEELQKSRKDLK